MGNEDLRKAEEFVQLMRQHYNSTLAVSSDRSPTCGQILPILQKLQTHYSVSADDSAFVRNVKENVWRDLAKRYQVQHTEHSASYIIFMLYELIIHYLFIFSNILCSLSFLNLG